MRGVLLRWRILSFLTSEAFVSNDDTSVRPTCLNSVALTDKLPITKQALASQYLSACKLLPLDGLDHVEPAPKVRPCLVNTYQNIYALVLGFKNYSAALVYLFHNK